MPPLYYRSGGLVGSEGGVGARYGLGPVLNTVVICMTTCEGLEAEVLQDRPLLDVNKDSSRY